MPSQRPLNPLSRAVAAGTFLVVTGVALALAKLHKDQNVADAGYAEAVQLRNIHLDLLTIAQLLNAEPPAAPRTLGQTKPCLAGAFECQ